MSHPKIISAVEAIRAIPPGCNVFIGESCGEPQTLTEAMIADKARLKGTRIIDSRRIPGSKYAKYTDYFKILTLHVTPDTREAVRTGKADFLPLRISEVPALLRSGRLPVDVALVQVSPPDPEGYCSLSVATGYTLDAALKAGMVIAEVNTEMPRAFGPNQIHTDRLTYIVESSRPLVECPYPEIGETEKAVAANVAKLIDDGSVLCFGIGALPEAVVLSLESKKYLGIHSGMISDGVVNAIKKGIFTNERKTLDKGKTVAGLAMGTALLYKFMHENPVIEMHPYTYTHDVRQIARLDNFVAIVSAVEVDATGQVNAESMGSTQISTVGGQADFIDGAALSRGGKSIIALTSTTKNGEISKIVPQFERGTIVTCPRYNARYIVTEYGIAELWGKTLAERKKALANIAHPNFRDQLLHSKE